MHKIPVWDLPLRIFHWSLAVLVVAAIISGKIGGNAFDWHLPIGYAILTLLLFRLVWGIVGGYHARFANDDVLVEGLSRCGWTANKKISSGVNRQSPPASGCPAG